MTINKKITNYDKFKCISDKCKFTCCSGWNINIDNNTYSKWDSEKHNCKYILDKIMIQFDNNIIVDKKISESCPFLDHRGLCNIVKNNGEDYLSLTCKMFPRIENIFEAIREFTLSCACPEVVDIISEESEQILLHNCKKEKPKEVPIEIKIRDTIVNIIQYNNLILEDKLMLSYKMMLSILEYDELTVENVLEEIEKYNDKDFVEKQVLKLNYRNGNFKDKIKEINTLFLDMIANYKKVPILREALMSISVIGESIYRKQIDYNLLEIQWNKFESEIKGFNLLLENCIVSKVLSSCIDEDVEEILISLQLIIIEYILVKYSTFLKLLNNDEKNLQQCIKDYIVVFSRVIGNNREAVIDFIYEYYDDLIIEKCL